MVAWQKEYAQWAPNSNVVTYIRGHYRKRVGKIFKNLILSNSKMNESNFFNVCTADTVQIVSLKKLLIKSFLKTSFWLLLAGHTYEAHHLKIEDFPL